MVSRSLRRVGGSINSFRWILYSTSSFQLSTSLELLESFDKFLQVPTSTRSPMAFSVSVV
jgi:hypothetical protein